MNTGPHSLLALCMGEGRLSVCSSKNFRVPCMASREQTAVKWGLLLGAEKFKANWIAQVPK